MTQLVSQRSPNTVSSKSLQSQTTARYSQPARKQLSAIFPTFPPKMERQKSVHQAFSLDDLDDHHDDPSYNPALLPPRSRADVVGERPAGGTPAEVASANPALAAAVPATVGSEGSPTDIATKVADYIEEKYHIHTSEESKEVVGGGASKQGGADEGAAAAGQAAVAGAGMRMGDGSGMETPELAILP